MGGTYYKKGDWNVICDRCGYERKASECRPTWEGYFVCEDTCWEPRQPQDFVRGVPDKQSVPIPRPERAWSFTEDYLTAEDY